MRYREFNDWTVGQIEAAFLASDFSHLKQRFQTVVRVAWGKEMQICSQLLLKILAI